MLEEIISKFGGTAKTVAWLRHFGYLAGGAASLANNAAAAIEALQRVGGLPVTGVIDAATLGLMERPRCGLCDNRLAASSSASRWTKPEITWAIADYLPGFMSQDQEERTAVGWARWAIFIPLKIRRATKADVPDVVISVGSGPQAGFDGPSGVLAWSYKPAGDNRQILMRFDVAEGYGPNSPIKYDNVFDHEAGHALGLDHDMQHAAALMAPFYSATVRDPTPWDVAAIQAVYGAAQPSPAPNPVPLPLPPGVTRLTIEGENLRVVT